MRARRECAWCEKEGRKAFLGWTETTDGSASHGICRYHDLICRRELGDAPPPPFTSGVEGRVWEEMERHDKGRFWCGLLRSLRSQDRPDYLRWLVLQHGWGVDRDAADWDALAAAVCIGYTEGAPVVAGM